MSIGAADVRSRISDGLLTALEPAGWSVSRYVVDLIGHDAQSLGHLCYSVGVASTTPHAQDRQSARGLERGTHAVSRVVVRWTARLRASLQVDDYDSALREEQRLVAAALAVDGDAELSVRWVGAPSRTVVGDGTYVLGTVDLDVWHRFPLVAPATPNP